MAQRDKSAGWSGRAPTLPVVLPELDPIRRARLRTALRVALVAGEHSGDQLGFKLMRALRAASSGAVAAVPASPRIPNATAIFVCARFISGHDISPL